MTSKQLGGSTAPDGSMYVTQTDGNGNLITPAINTILTPEQFGAIGNGIADDTNALTAMRDALRVIQNNSDPIPVLLTMKFGVNKSYAYTNNRWTWGLKNLQVLGNGSSFLMTGTTGSTFGVTPLNSNISLFETTLINGSFTVNSARSNNLISDTIPGDTSVTCLTPANASNLVPGGWAVVHSYCQLPEGGYLPNSRYFDYVKIVSSNSTTGVVILDRAIANRHSSNFPEHPFVTPDFQFVTWSGRARISPIGAYPSNNSILTCPFADYLYMENMTFVDNPNARRAGDGPGPNDPLYKSHQQCQIEGVYQATLKNINGSEFIPSGLYQADVIGCNWWACEADKFIQNLNFNNTSMNGVTIAVGLDEATGVNNLNYIGGFLHESVSAPRNAYYNGVTFNDSDISNFFALTGLAWPTQTTVVQSCNFTGGGGTSIPIGLSTSVPLLIDGTNVTVSANVVTIQDFTTFVSGRVFLRSVEPFGQINLLKAGGGAQIVGTFGDITGSFGTTTAILPISIASTISIGDTLECLPCKPGSVNLTPPNAIANTYTNFSGPPQIP